MTYLIQNDVFCDAYRNHLATSIKQSSELAASGIGPAFAQTLGFSVPFTRTDIPDVIAKHPYLRDFIERVCFSGANAFYLNPVVMNAGSQIARHVDCRTMAATGHRIYPLVVSVYYVVCSPDCGGVLSIFDKKGVEHQVVPIENRTVYFRGDAVHSVSEVVGNATRISLVVEQYLMECSDLQLYQLECLNHSR